MQNRTICAFVFMAVATSAAAQDAGFPAGVLSAPGGRFVFGQVSQYARHQYMLDVQTGRLWRLVCITPSSPPAGQQQAECLYGRLDPVYYGEAREGLPVLPSAPNLVPSLIPR